MATSRKRINYMTSILCPILLGVMVLEIDYSNQSVIKRDYASRGNEFLQKKLTENRIIPQETTLTVQEYEVGQTAALNCESNDNDHIFSFWQYPGGGDIIIGPGNFYDTTKYKYDVLTGQLFIKNVTPNEKGLYKCFSKGVRNKETYVQSVELVVESDWEDVYEDNTDLNLLRALMVMTVLLLILGIVFVVMKLNKKRIPHVYLDTKSGLLLEESSDEEDSVEDVFTSPKASTSSAKPSSAKNEFANIILNSVASTSKTQESSPEVETDFQGVFAPLTKPLKPLK